MKDLLAKQVRRKQESNRLLVERLSAAGYEIAYEELTCMTPSGSFNRAHVAALLQRKGYVSSMSQAFETLLAKHSPYYVAMQRLSALQVIAFLRAIGAAAVLAHPLLDLNEAELRAFLREAVPYGLTAIETRYATYHSDETELATRLATEFGVKESGGSDFHGERKPDIALGVGRGGLEVPLSFVDMLQKEIMK